MTREEIISAFKRLFPNILKEDTPYSFMLRRGNHYIKMSVDGKYYIFYYKNDCDYRLACVPKRSIWLKM